ncbi:MAG: hypothetical protein ACREOD_00115 [Candidatus Dormibacteria bacterium]
MKRYRQRILLMTISAAGLAGLGFGVASLTAGGVAAAPGAARVLAAQSISSPSANASAPAMHTCPNMASSSSSS